MTDVTIVTGGTQVSVSGVTLNSLTTTQRDALTAVTGMVIWNSTTAQEEYYNGSSWIGRSGGHVYIGVEAYDSVGAGTWTIGTQTAFIGNTQLFSNGADLENISYKVYLPKGTWTLRLYVQTGTDKGIVDVDIDSTEVATWDNYAASAVNNQVRTQTDISVATSGLKTLKFRVDGKNASSTSFILVLTRISLWRTA